MLNRRCGKIKKGNEPAFPDRRHRRQRTSSVRPCSTAEMNKTPLKTHLTAWLLPNFIHLSFFCYLKLVAK